MAIGVLFIITLSGSLKAFKPVMICQLALADFQGFRLDTGPAGAPLSRLSNIL